MSLKSGNNRNFDYFVPKFSYFNTGMGVWIDFIEISIKSTRMIPTNTSIIEPIKAGFSTNDRFVFTNDRLGILRVQPMLWGYGYNIL